MIYLKTISLLGMLFLHIVDDYYLQGWLASAKQKLWWEKNSPDKLYSHDYIMALCEHAFSWTFMVMLIPGAWTYVNQTNGRFETYLLCFALNWAIHSIVDDLKANVKTINLIQDQLIHIGQIILTWSILILIV